MLFGNLRSAQESLSLGFDHSLCPLLYIRAFCANRHEVDIRRFVAIINCTALLCDNGARVSLSCAAPRFDLNVARYDIRSLS